MTQGQVAVWLSFVRMKHHADLASEGVLDDGDPAGGDPGALGVEEGLAAVALQLGEAGHAGAVWRARCDGHAARHRVLHPATAREIPIQHTVLLLAATGQAIYFL